MWFQQNGTWIAKKHENWDVTYKMRQTFKIFYLHFQQKTDTRDIHKILTGDKDGMPITS